MAWYWPFKSAPVESAETAIVKAGPESFSTNASTPGPTKPAGSDGVAVTSGFIVSSERNPALVGHNKWTTYDNATLNVAIIAAAVNVWTQLAGSAKWTAEPNKRGGAKAQRAADIVTEGLLEAQMSIPWRAIVRRQVMKKFRGFALHEMVIRRRSDGMIVCADLGDRPQWTIYRWDIPDDQTPWQGVEQMTQFGKTYYIPRERLFYSVENTLSSTPDGVGLLRQMAEHVRVLELYQQWEGIGFQTDLRGVPVARAPLQELRKLVDPTGVRSEQEVRAGIQGATKFLTDFLMAHNKRADQGIMLDSATFRDVQGNPTGTAQWAFELVQGSGGSMAEVGVAIGRITREIARVMQAEWLMLGGEDSGGAYSMHEDKTAMFALIVNSALEDVADDATRDLATRLTALNGLDPETCTPKMVPEPIATGAVTEACQALATMATAGLDPRDPAINVLRARLRLPPAPPPDEAMLMLQRGGRPPEIGGGPTPDGGPTRPGLPPGQAPTPGGAQGEAGNPNARPDTEPAVQKYAPEQPREPDGRWGAGGGGGSSGARPWTLAFDDRDHQRTIDQHRRTESDSRAKANALKDKISELRAQSRGASEGVRARNGRQIARLSEQRDQHRDAAGAARQAKQAAQAHMEAARAEHVATRRAAAAERGDAEWNRARQEADSMMAIGQHRIGGDEGRGAEAAHHEPTPVHHVSEADTAAHMERAGADLQRHSDSLRSRDEHNAFLHRQRELDAQADSLRRAERGGSGTGGTAPAEPKRTQSEWNLHDQLQRESHRASDDRAGARNRAATSVHPMHAVSLPMAHTRSPGPGLASRLRSAFAHKRMPDGLDTVQIAKWHADALEDARLDAEAVLDEIEADIVVEPASRLAKFDDSQERDGTGRWSAGGGSDDERVQMAQLNSVGSRSPERDAEVERTERDAIANESAARNAGHLHDPPHAKLDAYAQARVATAQRVAEIHGALDAHHAAAAQALADLHAQDSEDHLSETRGLAEDHFNATSQHLGALHGSDSVPDFTPGSNHDAETDAPARLAHHAEYAQAALESLHAEQIKAALDLKASAKIHDRAARAARSEIEIDPKDLVDRSAIGTAHEGRARAAADSRLGYESMRRDELTGLSFEDAHDALSEETRQTARAVKELSKITGRVPKLSRPTATRH